MWGRWRDRLAGFWHRRRLSRPEIEILTTLAAGWTLKSHRYLDGTKVHRLHGLDGEIRPVGGDAVAHLERRGFIQTNHKFPAATYLLTQSGRERARRLGTDLGAP